MKKKIKVNFRKDHKYNDTNKSYRVYADKKFIGFCWKHQDGSFYTSDELRRNIITDGLNPKVENYMIGRDMKSSKKWIAEKLEGIGR